MFLITSMITFKDAPWHSHATPVAPAGSDVPPPPATTTGAGTVIPRADPTVAAVGHVTGDAAAVECGAAGAGGVAATAAGGLEPEPPHPATADATRHAASTRR